MLLSDNTGLLCSSVLVVQALANKLGLILSLAKSSIFATTTKLRNQLFGAITHHGLLVGESANISGLGVNFQTAKQASLGMRDRRWLSAKQLLDRLQYMPWNPQKKTDIICRCVLPHVLFGVENTFVGKDLLREIRAKCHHAVGGKLQYHLHYLAPVFSGTIYEPFLHIARRRFSIFTRALVQHGTLVRELWKLSVQKGHFFKKKTRGGISILQNQLHEMGYTKGT